MNLKQPKKEDHNLGAKTKKNKLSFVKIKLNEKNLHFKLHNNYFLECYYCIYLVLYVFMYGIPIVYCIYVWYYHHY